MPVSDDIWPPRLLMAPLVVAGLVALRQKRDRPIELLTALTLEHKRFDLR